MITAENTSFYIIAGKIKNSYVDGGTSDCVYIIKRDLINDGKSMVIYELEYRPYYDEQVDDSDVFNETCSVIGVILNNK